MPPISLSPGRNRIGSRVTIGAAAILCLASLVAFWPGVAMYDTVTQYAQVQSGIYDDWHPPIMARLWAVLAQLGPGATPMLVLQLATYWLGLGALATALAKSGRARGAIAILVIGVLPPFLGWQVVVLKDAQLTGALLAATGLIAWARIAGRTVSRATWIAVALLVLYAVLVRANAVFAAVPLIVMLSPRPARPVAKLATVVAATLIVLGISPLINHGLLRAQPSGVARTQALYDLAAIAARAPNGHAIMLTRAEADTVIARHCASPFFWDPLGDDKHCGQTMARLNSLPVGTLYVGLAGAALHHPLAYAAHRFEHLNSTDRWLVPIKWTGAAPPATSEPNTVGLGSPGAVAASWQALSAVAVETPLGWPIAWIVTALIALAVCVARYKSNTGSGAVDVAAALLVSALALEASFAVLSIASDLRYHLWSMIATAVAIVLLADRPPPRRIVSPGAVILLVVIGAGLFTRATLPESPQSYRDMLGWAG